MTIAAPSSRSRVDVLRGYIALTKPRIIELLLVTTVPTMVVAANGIPGLWLIVATLIGGTLLGLIGALVAIPVAATIHLLLEEVAVPRQNQR